MNTSGAGSGHDDADIIGWLGVAAATDSLASCPAPGALTALEAFGLVFVAGKLHAWTFLRCTKFTLTEKLSKFRVRQKKRYGVSGVWGEILRVAEMVGDPNGCMGGEKRDAKSSRAA